MEFLCGPIFVLLLLLNFRSGIRANGSSKERIISKQTVPNVSRKCSEITAIEMEGLIKG